MACAEGLVYKSCFAAYSTGGTTAEVGKKFAVSLEARIEGKFESQFPGGFTGSIKDEEEQEGTSYDACCAEPSFDRDRGGYQA
jgi:hypothetical protein